jgi:hypothetical protein
MSNSELVKFFDMIKDYTKHLLPDDEPLANRSSYLSTLENAQGNS